MKNEIFKRLISSVLLIPIVIFIIVKGSILFNIFILLCFFISAYEWHAMSKKKNYSIFGLIFLIISFYLVYKIRNDFNGEYFYLLFVILICVATDIGGYIFGNILKGPKLTSISPKKTYSGMLGGYILSILCVYFYLNISFNEIQIDMTNHIIFIVIIISTVSQLGDLLISYFKRLSKIKDTGRIIPGHGGLLDRIDGMIFALPFSYILFILNIFN
jgi:phosphatidate cytidylyltransferase|tara:strand:- start:939 stop:1586 length:648 start_codon:yes stop_codon:yes gene_type:complete